MIQDVGWGGGPASDGKTLFARPTGSRGQFGGERSHLSGDGGAVWGERGQCREVVAALACERQRGSQADGWVAAAAATARARVAAGADCREAGPNVAGVVAELAERGTPASYGAVWRFFKHEGMTFKKNSARQRAGSRRHRSPPDPVEGASGPA